MKKFVALLLAAMMLLAMDSPVTQGKKGGNAT